MKILPALFLLTLPIAAAQDSADLLRRADGFYQRGSFEKANELYVQADRLELEEGPERFVDFRIADTAWRSAAASKNPDTSRLDTALQQLQSLLGQYPDPEERDQTWADVQESLGDFYWGRRDSANWHQAWTHYSEALNWWAGSREIDAARERYLAIVFNIVQPAWWTSHSYDSWSSRLDVRTLEQAAKIANDEEDKGWTGFFLGYARYRIGPTYEGMALAGEAFETVLALDPKNEWRDDALYHYGVFLEEKGQVRYREDGSTYWHPDYIGAVAKYRQILEEYKDGETRYYNNARDRIKKITGAELSVGVDRFFVPGSEVQYRLRWRNVGNVSFSLYPVDLTRDVNADEREPSEYADGVNIGRTGAVATWKYETGDEGEHRPGEVELTIENKPGVGAYMLVARAGGASSSALILVSDALLSTKAGGGQILGWYTDLETGAPIPEARVFLWERYHDGGWRSRTAEGLTAADGTVLFEREKYSGNSSFFLAAAIGDRQAFATGSGYWPYSQDGTWKVYGHSDRPAYRPEDVVQWKLVARVLREDGYDTPADAELKYKILDPRGQVVDEGDATLNSYGTVWGSMETTPAHPLGVYSVQLWRGNDRLSQAQLFRLEEYKLPEYEVSVTLPDDPERPGHPKLYRLGDELEAVVQAEYYYGGPVAGAQVEVLVYQRPYYHYWVSRYEYPWYYTDGLVYRGWWGGPGQMLQRETYTADAEGKVYVPIQTQSGSANDLEYTIEARVVDASRREVVAQNTLRVTRQSYYVQVAPTHSIHKPGDRVELEFEAQDANKNPIAAAGEVVVTRDTWTQVWQDPQGKEYRGKALEALRDKHKTFPPSNEQGWILVYNGYERDEVARTRILIGLDGKADWKFQAQREGYYTVAWTSEDDRHQRIHAQASFWVANNSSQELGYRQGGVEIIVDKDTFRVGDTASVMLAAATSDRYVLFTVEGDDLRHYEVVHLKGTVKLVTLDIEREHIPNIYLGALMVSDRQTWWDQVEVVVPPEEQFLQIELATDQEAYEPGDEGTVVVTVKDHLGQPVTGEVSLAVYDAALAYIQGELAGDPREFFFGERVQQYVRTSSTLSHRQFQKLLKDSDGQIVDELYAARQDRDMNGFARNGADPALRDLSFNSPFDSFNDSKEGRRQKGLASEMSAAPSGPGKKGGFSRLEALGYAGGGGYRGPGDSIEFQQMSEVEVRTDFRDTAVWAASVETDEEGQAVIEVPYPDSTTRWTAIARANDTGSRVGIGETSVRTRQPLIARLQTPRFLQAGDEVTISANLNNNTTAVMPVLALLEVEGVELLGRLKDGELFDPETGAIKVAPNGQERVDWLVRVVSPGSALLRLKAVSPEHSDGMERRLPVEAHGIEVFLGTAGKMTADELALAIDLPGARADGTTSLSVELTPSLAVTMLDSLPYLVHYPYGCTEQTLSRFLPAVVVAGTLREFGLDAETALDRVFGGIEREFVDKTQPKGPGSIEKLDDVVAHGLERLYDFQHSDGGWAWWKTGESNHWMTAYVVWGLTLAQEAGIEVRGSVLDRGRDFLDLNLVENELDPDVQSWMLFALAKRLAHDEQTSANADRAFSNPMGEAERAQRLHSLALRDRRARDGPQRGSFDAARKPRQRGDSR